MDQGGGRDISTELGGVTDVIVDEELESGDVDKGEISCEQVWM